MAKKKKKSHAHKAKSEVHKEKKSNSLTNQLMPKDSNAMISIAIFVLIGLIVGSLVTFAAFSVQPQTSSNGGGVSVAELESKVASYLNDNLVVDDTVLATIVDSNDLGDGLYQLEFSIEQDGENVGGGYVYATENSLILGTLFDLDEALDGLDDSNSSDTDDTTAYTKSDTPMVDLFIMSFCPYGLQAVGAFDDAITLLDESIDFRLGYVIYENYASNYGQDWQDYCWTENEDYCSMHGINELTEDLRQLCIQRDQSDKLWPYMRLLVADYQAGKVSASNINEMWTTYADAVGVDTTAVEECVASDALTLLAEQKSLNDTYGVTGSPSALINEIKYSGSRTSEAFKDAICSAFNTMPGVCGEELDSQTAAANGSC